MMTAKKTKSQEEAGVLLLNLKLAWEEQQRKPKRVRKALADMLYQQYASTMFGYEHEDWWTPGLDEGLAYQYLADDIYRDIGLEPLGKREIEDKWHR